MCLKVFVNGDTSKYQKLKPYAMSLGSAFQKVNFLRDLNADFENLERTYFPNLNVSSFDEKTKDKIINEIETDFDNAVKGNFFYCLKAQGLEFILLINITINYF